MMESYISATDGDAKLQCELQEAKQVIKELKEKLNHYEQNENMQLCESTKEPENSSLLEVTQLTNRDIRRYSRQLILPEIGVRGQLALSNTSVLLVGAGGLGCPAAIYLAAAGIGHIGVVDFDHVELDNLHRQILHTEQRIGKSKSGSIATSIHNLNFSVKCQPYHLQLNKDNALPLIKQYDIILDCTDNVATRYLLNDACVLANKPLVSASALRFEGQLTVYNYDGGPCYRCLFPKPPPPETVTNCSDGGVLGVVPGIMGSLQALEAIKMAAGLTVSYAQKLLLFDALFGGFRSIKLRPKKKDCAVCGETPSVTKLIDYEEFCGAGPSDKCLSLHILPPEDRITVKELAKLLEETPLPILVDVRSPVEFEICHLENSINIPLAEIEKPDDTSFTEKVKQVSISRGLMDRDISVVVLCRRGNDSQKAIECLKTRMSSEIPVTLKDVIGGLSAWSLQVDPDFPQY
ncbi:Adenylyltransferase and sulfurtransferase MOCS3 [Holothuria leucospilota]|uniref:Adenylyltransferase and sulfurtransferase MOCS3 homolog n=1 Tax=Holothuria leucospilota TaxID=206669 RepID=A0A9Q1HGQ4_HOLLE|nr:Adenylyltransferase and sulfurtransferase MOCS3 [Holothuria leucospilota]